MVYLPDYDARVTPRAPEPSTPPFIVLAGVPHWRVPADRAQHLQPCGTSRASPVVCARGSHARRDTHARGAGGDARPPATAP